MNGPRQFSFANAQEPAANAIKSDFGGGEEHAEEDENESVVIAPRRPKKVVQAITPKNVVKLAKQRLRDIKKEIRKLKQLEKERAELERLIEAAEGRQVRSVGGAVVGSIKRSTG